MLDQDIGKMKVSELREALKAKGLNTTGNKQELVDRLSAALLDGSHIDSKFEDDLLNDDDLDHEEKSLLESTKDLLSPDTSKSTSPETPAPAKKITLKRNIITVQPLLEEKTETEKKEDDLSEPDKKVIKISEMTAKDRLEMRAKQFGATSASTAAAAAPSNEKLEARAARFGIAASATASAAAVSTDSSSSNNGKLSDEVLKKRAERFGAISNVVKKSELDDKLQKRAARFGESAASATTGKVAITAPSSEAKNDYAEKARLRLERFKQTA